MMLYINEQLLKKTNTLNIKMKQLANTILVCAMCLLASCASTEMTLANGAKFKTNSNGKSLSMTLPGGGSLRMEEYDHASSILAQGEAIKNATGPLVDLGKTGLWTNLWKHVSSDTKDTTTHLNDNQTSLDKQINQNSTNLEMQKAALQAQQ